MTAEGVERETPDPAVHVVGREPELAVLESFLDSEHSQRALVLAGGPGIGKTTVWEAGIGAARDRVARVLATRAIGVEARLPFTTLTDLLDGVEVGAPSGLPPPQSRALEVALLRAESAGSPPEPRAVALGLLDALRALAAAGGAVPPGEVVGVGHARPLRFAASRRARSFGGKIGGALGAAPADTGRLRRP